MDNVPDLHGNPVGARLVIFIAGNQFFVLPQLVAAFEQQHPDIKGAIFYESSPRNSAKGDRSQQHAYAGQPYNSSEAGRLRGRPTCSPRDGKERRGARCRRIHDERPRNHGSCRQSQAHWLTEGSGTARACYISAEIRSGRELGNQIAASLRKAGGEPLEQAVYGDKVKTGKTVSQKFIIDRPRSGL